LNKVKDISVKNLEGTEADKSDIEYHLDKYLSMWEKYLSMCGPLEPLMRLKLGIPHMRGNRVEEV
jgi:hypothetical protein